MPKKLPFLFLLTLSLAACCLPAHIPQISNRMGWTWGSKIAFQGDKDFTPEERSDIALACAQWTAWTGGGIICSVTFERDFKVQPFAGDPDDFAIVKTTSLGIWQASRGQVDPGTILGYAPSDMDECTGERYGLVLLASDNVGRAGLWNHTAKHEIGHVLGFSHVDQHHERPNVMHASYSNELGEPNTPQGFGDDDKAQCMRLGLCKQ